MEKLKDIVRKFDKYKFVLLAGIAGILLLLLPTGSKDKKTVETQNIKTTEEYFNVVEYEQKLENILGQVDGVGRVKVMLTLESDYETIYAMDSEMETEYADTEKNSILQETVKEEYVVIRTDDDFEAPITRKIIYPVFKGAVIVCDGGNKADIQLKVLKSVRSLTGIPADRISVQKMEGQGRME